MQSDERPPRRVKTPRDQDRPTPPLREDNDDQRLGQRSRNAVFFREMFGESAELLERVENLRGQFEAFLETRAVFLGTETQPGLMVTIEEFQGQISVIEKQLSELTAISQSALEMRDLSQNLLVAIPDRLLGALNSSVFDEKLKREVVRLIGDLGHEIALGRLELAANQFATEAAGESAGKLMANILAERGAENVVALAAQLETIEANARIQLAEMESAHAIKISKLNTQHLREIDGLHHQLRLAKSELANKTAELETQSNRLALATQAREKNVFGWVVVSVVVGTVLGAVLPDLLKFIGK
jgi:hypothetical protein